jgi:pimeloyl-ACP methyl ester carboxylesterase
MNAPAVQVERRSIHANGIDIHYAEAGAGEPLLLLHGGLVSTNPLWAGHPLAYVAHMQTLAEHFRVIAPDTRGCGKTTHSGGAITFTQLADDVLALIDRLGLTRPLICGFSEGATTATIAGMRSPSSIRAIVNDAGYDVLNPNAPSLTMMRHAMGGSPRATRADFGAIEKFFGASDEMHAAFSLMKADQDGGQGPGHWKTYLSLAFDRITQPPGYTFDDLGKITVPTLVLVGDRDDFCSVEEAATTYRKLPNGTLAVLPNVGHFISPSAVRETIEFLRRHA